MSEPKATLVARHGDDALADPDKLDDLAAQMRKSAEGSKEEGWKVLAATLEACARRLRAQGEPEELDVVFDGPPEHEAGRFVEVEVGGKSVRRGEWIARPDGNWALRLKGFFK